MTRPALSASDQRAGSSAAAFSSSRRRTAASQSKMPPQQGHRFGDLLVQGFGVGAHGGAGGRMARRGCPAPASGHPRFERLDTCRYPHRMATDHLVPGDLLERYHVKEWRNAAGVLATACPDEWKDV